MAADHSPGPCAPHRIDTGTDVDAVAVVNGVSLCRACLDAHRPQWGCWSLMVAHGFSIRDDKDEPVTLLPWWTAPSVAALIASAPQLAADLEEAVRLLRECHPEQQHQHAGMRCWFCEARVFLARLDARKP